MMKPILFISTMLIAGTAQAESIEQWCQPTNPKISVSYDIKPVTYNTSLSSKELPMHQNDNRGYYLGSFSKNLYYQTKANIESVTQGKKQCSKIVEVNVILTFTPTIYIAKEVMQYYCSQQIVLNHEHEHHKVELEALNINHNYLYHILENTYKNIPATLDKNYLNDIMQQLQNETYKQFEHLQLSYTEPYHEQIDLPENKEKESRQCPLKERQAIEAAIFKNT